MDAALIGLGMLAVTLALALAGVGELIAASARRATLAVTGEAAPRRRAIASGGSALGRALAGTPAGAGLTEALETAGVAVSPAGFLALCGGSFAAGYALASFLVTPIVAAGVGAAAVVGCFAWLARERGRRREALIGQLPELARLLSNGSSAGLSMPAALELAGRELDEPAGPEVRHLVAEIALGRQLDDALEALQHRVQSREVAVLVTTLVIQQRAGGDVVKALREIGATLDARKEMIREVRTVLSGSVFTSYLVAALGVGTLVMLDLIRPGVVGEMVASPVGIAALGAAAGLFATGFALIRRTVRVES